MHAMESSDRRMKWESVAETMAASPPYLVLADRDLGPGYFLEETVASLQVVAVRLSGVSLLACTFEGGRWIDTAFESGELTHVTFRHVYFQAADFRGANLRHVKFEHCIFSECHPPEGEGVETLGCFFREAPAPTPVAAPPPAALLPTAVASAPAPAPAKAASAPADRFDGLER